MVLLKTGNMIQSRTNLGTGCCAGYLEFYGEVYWFSKDADFRALWLKGRFNGLPSCLFEGLSACGRRSTGLKQPGQVLWCHGSCLILSRNVCCIVHLSFISWCKTVSFTGFARVCRAFKLNFPITGLHYTSWMLSTLHRLSLVYSKLWLLWESMIAMLPSEHIGLCTAPWSFLARIIYLSLSPGLSVWIVGSLLSKSWTDSSAWIYLGDVASGPSLDTIARIPVLWITVSAVLIQRCVPSFPAVSSVSYFHS